MIIYYHTKNNKKGKMRNVSKLKCTIKFLICIAWLVMFILIKIDWYVWLGKLYYYYLQINNL